MAPEGKLALSFTQFEEHPPFTTNPKTARLVSFFHERAVKANVPYPFVDVQAANSFAAWMGVQRDPEEDLQAEMPSSG